MFATVLLGWLDLDWRSAVYAFAAGGLVFAVLCAYLTLALFTYSPCDPGWSVAPADGGCHRSTVNPRPDNWGGSAGAMLADLMLFVFGFSAWWWSILRPLPVAAPKAADLARKRVCGAL